jgi:hypothetical protein
VNIQTKSSLRLGVRDFAVAFDSDISGYVAGRIAAQVNAFDYRPLPAFKRDEWLRVVVEALTDSNLTRSGEHRLPAWEKGWSENLTGSLVPKYFGKFPVVRWCREFIEPTNSSFEYEAFGIIKDWLFDKHFRDVSHIFEFGCGTGHNLLAARRVNPHAMLHALDWARSSQQVIDANAGLFGNRVLTCNFDLFKPPRQFPMLKGAGVFTAAALEQTGDRFRTFIDWLIERRPGVVIHIEPINELLDPNNLMDYLSIQYARKRGYLSGLLDYLRQKAADGAIEILTAKRTGIGSLFLDGYSVIVWRPK